MYTVEETDMLAAKLDLLIKCLDKKGAPMVPSNRSTHIYHMRCAETLDTWGTTASKPIKTRVQEQRVLSTRRSRVESVTPTTSGR
jgi:hypothetical protein